MKRKNFYGKGNDPFTCEECQMNVEKLSNGSFRNHCPYCLWCKHVDIVPGDRAEICHGSMAPLNIEHSSKGWILIHKCSKCGKKQKNKTAPDDNIEMIVQLMS